MLQENTLFGTIDKVAKSIDRLRYFEPPEGYYLAFSGGKDSQCIYHLAKEAGVKFDAHYNITTVDPPELVRFIKNNYPEVELDHPKKTMWRLIEKNGLPTRLVRFCCKHLKEGTGKGRANLTGVRWEESVQRAKRKPFEIMGKSKHDAVRFDDNSQGRIDFKNYEAKSKIINPIIDWTEMDVWEFLDSRGIGHCQLYDEGFSRLGCIGCPMGSERQRLYEFERWPKYYESYKRAVTRFLVGYTERKKAKGIDPQFTTAEEMMEWWIYGKVKNRVPEGQISFDVDKK